MFIEIDTPIKGPITQGHGNATHSPAHLIMPIDHRTDPLIFLLDNNTLFRRCGAFAEKTRSRKIYSGVKNATHCMWREQSSTASARQALFLSAQFNERSTVLIEKRNLPFMVLKLEPNPSLRISWVEDWALTKLKLLERISTRNNHLQFPLNFDSPIAKWRFLFVVCHGALLACFGRHNRGEQSGKAVCWQSC